MSPLSIKSHFRVFLYVSLLLFCESVLASWIPNDVLPKRQAPAVATLVDFQVYEPILTPSGTSDQHGCVYTKELMTYEFGNSYGAPFVGMCLRIRQPPASNNRCIRRLHPSSLPLQSSHHEFHRHIQRPPIRSSWLDVPWRCRGVSDVHR